MELCGKEVLFPDAGNKRLAIGSEGGDPLCLLWNDIIGVDKIEEITALYRPGAWEPLSPSQSYSNPYGEPYALDRV